MQGPLLSSWVVAHSPPWPHGPPSPEPVTQNIPPVDALSSGGALMKSSPARCTPFLEVRRETPSDPWAWPTFQGS